MQTLYLVSIITVCYNSERTIRRTIQSVLNQTYPNIEYIIIDAKSTDKTLEIVNEYIEEFQGRIKIVSEKDDGIFDAMNKGIRMSKGEIIGIINSDDYYEKDAVENIVKHLDIRKKQVYYGMMRVLDHGKEKKVEIESHNFITKTMIPHCTCFVQRVVYEKYGLFDLKYKYVADYDLMYRYSLIKEIEFVPIYCIISNFSEGGASSTYAAKKEAIKFRYEKKLIGAKRFYLLLIKLQLERLAMKWIL